MNVVWGSASLQPTYSTSLSHGASTGYTMGMVAKAVCCVFWQLCYVTEIIYWLNVTTVNNVHINRYNCFRVKSPCSEQNSESVSWRKITLGRWGWDRLSWAARWGWRTWTEGQYVMFPLMERLETPRSCNCPELPEMLDQRDSREEAFWGIPVSATDHWSKPQDYGGDPGEKDGIKRNSWVTAGDGLSWLVRKEDGRLQ